VYYFGFGNKDELKPSSLRSIQRHYELYDKDNISVGFKCEAKYYVDGVYYEGSVVEKTQYGYKFLFDGYGNAEEIPLEYMREPSSSLSHSSAVDSAPNVQSQSASVLKAAPIDTKLLKIPDNLQILATDTEAEKERKRKRIKAIKSLNRHKSYEIERNQKQQGWKSFQSKAIKKKAKGTSGVLSKRGSSIFASPDTVDGKVGVVGSGQGMTTFQDARKKYKR
jgi:survival-of-motor-neuron-related-splicing factor 30